MYGGRFVWTDVWRDVWTFHVRGLYVRTYEWMYVRTYVKNVCAYVLYVRLRLRSFKDVRSLIRLRSYSFQLGPIRSCWVHLLGEGFVISRSPKTNKGTHVRTWQLGRKRSLASLGTQLGRKGPYTYDRTYKTYARTFFTYVRTFIRTYVRTTPVHGTSIHPSIHPSTQTYIRTYNCFFQIFRC